MATHFRDTTSIDVVADTAHAIAAALQSDTEAASLAPIWDAVTAKADELALERRTLFRAARRARARLSVQDTLWDRMVAGLGRAVVDACGGHRDAPGYSRFFAKLTPSAAQRFGVQREVDTGRNWVVELGRDPAEALSQTWTPKVKAATDALEVASKERDQAVRALGPHQTSVLLFIDDANRELDKLEGQLKQLFPGEAARVASFLAATRAQRSAPAEEPEPAPDTTPTPAP
ncbi:MAG: hypothetical protein JW940_07615 [Polyangiaceae bacterium]|nr:hypothetical protein [Polyangiaceae bacterium]